MKHRPHRPATIGLLLLAWLASTAASPALAPSASKSEQVDALFAEWDRPDSAGCAVGVIDNGQLVHRGGRGFADRLRGNRGR